MTEEITTVEDEPTPPADEPQKTFDADYVTELRAENASWRKKFRELEKQMKDVTVQQEQAKQKELAEQGKYQELFNEAAAQVKALEPLKDRVDAMEGALSKVLEAQRQSVPEGIRALLDKLDPVDQLEWLAENAKPAEPEQPAKLQPFSPASGDPQRLSDKQLLEGLRRDLGHGSGLFG